MVRLALAVATTLSMAATSAARPGADFDPSRPFIPDPTCLVAAPVFEPPPGTYWASPAITVTTATPDAQVWLSMNGGSFHSFSAPVVLPPDSVTSLTAHAFLLGCRPSPAATATYVITGQVPPPDLEPGSGTYHGPLNLVVTPPPGATVSVTTDGSPPGPGSGLVSDDRLEVELATHAELRAIAYRDGWQTSPEASGTYRIAYDIGGEVRRLTGEVVLELNGEDPVSLSSDGEFSFPGALLDGAEYEVAVRQHPDDQVCGVRNGSGVLTHSDVTDVEVICRLASNVANQLFILMAESDVDELYSRDPMSEDQLPGFARFAPDGADVALRGIRFRGSTSRFLPKKSFNIRFDRRQDVLFRSSRMNLNAMYTDPSMMREALGMELFRMLGAPAPRTRYFDFYLNEVFEGLHIHIERIDDDMVAAWGLNPDGTLVRDGFRDNQDHPLIAPYGRWSAFGFDLGQLAPEEQTAFLAATFESRGSPEWHKVADLLAWVHDTPPGAAFAAGFAERFEDDIFVDWLAAHILLADIDSFWDDYWLYLDHADPEARWIPIPWDKDLTFGSHTRSEWGVANHYFAYELYPWTTGGNRLLEKFFETPVLRTRLADRLGELLEIVTPVWLAQRIDELWQEIGMSAVRQPRSGIAFHRHPANHHGDVDHAPHHLATLEEFLQLRRRFLQTFLAPAAGTPYYSEVPLNGTAAGEPITFTDAAGWTMARLVPATDPEPSGVVVVEVVPQAGIAGVDRVWRITSTAGDLQGEITLYYRNDILEWAGKENWVTDSDDPVGRQWELVVAHFADGLAVPIAGSRPNPYANAVTAPVVLAGPGTHQLVLVFSGDSSGSPGSGDPAWVPEHP